MNKIILGVCLACNDPETQDLCDKDTLRLCAIASLVATGRVGFAEACKRVSAAGEDELREIVGLLDRLFGIKRA